DEDAEALRRDGLVSVDVEPDLYDAYYEGFSNGAIWPLFHYMTDRCRFTAMNWEAYHKVNQAFADAILEVVEDGDRIWIHDYQLMLLPDMLRREKRDLTIGFFLHIPFPSAEVFRILPWRREVLVGLLGADLIGFHTLEYMRHFSNAVARIMGLEPQMDTLNYGRRTVRLGAFPLGVNVGEINEVAHSPEAEKHLADLNGLFRGRKMILGVDRLDYTKGIPQRLEAFAAFLKRFPEQVGKVSLVQVSVPSRINVGEYREIKSEVDGLVGMINGQYGMPGYSPIHYIFRSLDKHYLFALYRRADVALVTPIRDGLNLVCKEYVAAKGDEPGVLVLSEFAGAAAEMGEAILVNPWSQDSVVAGINTALDLSADDASSMMFDLYGRLSRHDNRAWSTSFLASLDEVREMNRGSGYPVTAEPDREVLLSRLRSARRAFFFIDYDGTLVKLVDKPEQAVAPPEITRLLLDMSRVPQFHVSVVSGRDRAFLEEHLPREITIVAEHGACIRRAGEEECVHLVDEETYRELRENVHGVMRDFQKRIPGSHIEEKEFGLVWHYRMSDPIFAHQQALALADTLGGLLQHTPLGVLISKKAVEVRHISVNKGEAVRAIIDEEDFDPELDILLSMGDDRTDEDMFRVYPGVNVSICVSDTPMLAAYSMEQEALLDLLEQIARQAHGWQRPMFDRDRERDTTQ
ncbi:MAG: bifunctional alpha,alpha-trehalose-phosphate synthase (UDP-forming)/trehalose-phosphatase, partial [Myxococcales bacterium]